MPWVRTVSPRDSSEASLTPAWYTWHIILISSIPSQFNPCVRSDLLIQTFLALNADHNHKLKWTIRSRDPTHQPVDSTVPAHNNWMSQLLHIPGWHCTNGETACYISYTCGNFQFERGSALYTPMPKHTNYRRWIHVQPAVLRLPRHRWVQMHLPLIPAVLRLSRPEIGIIRNSL